jgi:hypothetical protein
MVSFLYFNQKSFFSYDINAFYVFLVLTQTKFNKILNPIFIVCQLCEDVDCYTHATIQPTPMQRTTIHCYIYSTYC